MFQGINVRERTEAEGWMILANLLSGSDSRLRAPVMNRTTRKGMSEWTYVVVGKKSLSEGEDTQQTEWKGSGSGVISLRRSLPAIELPFECQKLLEEIFLEVRLVSLGGDGGSPGSGVRIAFE